MNSTALNDYQNTMIHKTVRIDINRNQSKLNKSAVSRLS